MQKLEIEGRLDPLEERVDQNQQNIITLQEELEQLGRLSVASGSSALAQRQ